MTQRAKPKIRRQKRKKIAIKSVMIRQKVAGLDYVLRQYPVRAILCFFQFREEIKQEDEAARLKRQEQEGYKSSTGYGGKFGVMEDRQDKSAVGWDHAEKAAKHESQKGKGLLKLSSLL